jgi:hypothetical protein
MKLVCYDCSKPFDAPEVVPCPRCGYLQVLSSEKRSEGTLLQRASGAGEVALTMNEAAEFLRRHRQDLDELPLDFMIRGYGGDNCDQCAGLPECVHYVGMTADDVAAILDEQMRDIEPCQTWSGYALWWK